MGRRWSRKRKAENKNEKKQKQKSQRDKVYVPIFQGNAKMEAYYAYQGLHNHCLEGDTFRTCANDTEREEERLKWLDTLRSILPASFRVGENVDPILRERLEKEMDEFVGTEMEIEIDPAKGKRSSSAVVSDKEESENAAAGEKSTTEATPTTTRRVAPVRKIPFIPHAYQLSLDRRTIRRNASLQKFHDWLKVQTSAGFVTRQETVSMIPPVVLGVEPSHAVLDMCAAPGSKTSQLLELVSKPFNPNDLEPRGFVVANDSDPKRAYMLVHQLRRINSPAVFCTSCDAQFFPLLKSKEEKQTGQEGLFDRVLCDVPCSGDGTTRKNPGVWKSWNQHGALALHPLQVSIALNGARLTKVGGCLVYSTCSMNPIENEAVVAEILRASDGSLELVDKRTDMEGLLARPGWTSWKVLKEEKSRNQEKNFRKKNNAKMKKRRQEWAEKRRKLEQEGTSSAENGETEPMEIAENDKSTDTKDENGSEKVRTGADGDANQEEGATKEEPPFVSARKDFGPPLAWDEETLRARCQQMGLVEYKSFDEVPQEFRRRVRSSCFPPTEEEVKQFGLEKCMRCLPQDMDAGGFFVALLRKVAPMSATAKERALQLARELRSDVVDNEGISGATVDAAAVADEPKAKEENALIEDSAETESNISSNVENIKTEEEADPDEEAKESGETIAENGTTEATKIVKGKELLRGRGKTRGDLGNENFIPINDDIWAPHLDFYGFAPTFPRDQFMSRACGGAKVLYFISNAIKTKLIDRGIQDRVTVINSGLKGFERNNKECDVQYRIAQEGIHYVAPHMTKRKIVVKFDDFDKCLADGAIRLEIFSEEFAAAVRPLVVGSFCVALDGFEKNIFKKMFLVMWRCRGDAINCLVSKIEMDGMKSKLRAIQEQKKKSADANEK